MKKTIVLLAGIALMAAGCTKTEVVSSGPEDSQKGINFAAYASRTTKAAQVDVTNDNFNSFKVTAIGNGAVYFDNVTFEKNETPYWESDTKYFWPAFALDFYAYNTPAKGIFSRDITIAGQTLTFTPSETLSEQEDLVVAKTTGQTEPAGGATVLTFSHYLTQVIVKAKNSSETYKVEVDGVKLANFKNKGTYNFSTETMVADDTKTKYEASISSVELASTATEVMTNGANGRWYLVPQTVTAWNQATDLTNDLKGTYLALKVKITAKSGALKIYPATGTDSAWMAVPVDPSVIQFLQGHKYTITVNFFSTDAGAISGGAGYVDPEVPGDLDGDGSKDDDAGKKIIGGVIKFNATVNDWSTNSHEITIEL